MKIKKEIIVLILIILLAGVLRFCQLEKSPPGLYVDEAAIGYNSNSILLTGKDEFGKKFPVFFRSFGDYKLPLYIYLSTLPIKIFGLNVFSVRFISALSGTITGLLIYALVTKIFSRQGKTLGLIASLFWVISPWSVLFSRAAFEAPLALLFFLAGFYFQLTFFEKEKLKILLLSMVFYSLSVYTYHTERFLAPIFVFLSMLIFLKQKKFNQSSFKTSLLGVGVFLLLIFPQYYLFPSFAGQARISSLSIIGENNLASLPKRFFALYFAYFSPKNLFFETDPDLQRSLPELSVFYSWMVIPWFLGIIEFFKRKTDLNLKTLKLFLFLSPLPAALATDPFSSLRAFPLIFPFLIFVSLGIMELKKLIRSNRVWRMAIFSLVILSMALLFRSLFFLLPKERYSYWYGGHWQLAKKMEEISTPGILIDDPVGVSYIEFLFYQDYSPEKYQAGQKINLKNYYRLNEWENVFAWDRFSVRPINWEKDIYTPQLIVARPIAISPSQAKEHFLDHVFAIIGPSGEELFNGYLTNPELKKTDNLKKENESRNF